MKIRVVKTASNAKAVQVVRYHNNKRSIMLHIPEHTHPLIPVELSLQEQQ